MPAPRPVIYQLFLRLFSNTHPAPIPNGTLSQNGVGRFADLTSDALRSLRDLGVTHLWLLGVLRHATGTPHPGVGLPADDPDLLKGIAGSPFAVRDCFDVCPDLATHPQHRLAEFKLLVQRIHQHGLGIIIDFVPNHVARSHHSVVRPDLEFGLDDDRSTFFSARNHFFHLPGQGPLRLPTVREGQPVTPTCQALGGCDGMFDRERDQARVTGNNVTSPSPGLHDWFETVKLNYGFDFTRDRTAPRSHPTTAHPDVPIPDTWLRMDAVLEHWQGLGVDGFRCDMAHWIPMEFWDWSIRRARERRSGCLFIAEAYDDDPNKVTDGNVLTALLDAGFDAVYDDLSYDLLKGVFDGPKWANDLDHVLGRIAPLHQSLRYSENHDEVRLAHPDQWGGIGPQVGLPVSAILMGIGRGPILIHNGQEVGEPALDPAHPGSGNARTSLFDYGHMPELARWVNGHRYDGGGLSRSQKALRHAYSQLLHTLHHPAFQTGDFIPLNPHNVFNPDFGRLPGETAGGHWLYAWIRKAPHNGPCIICLVNLHPSVHHRNVRVQIPADALAQLPLLREKGSIELGNLLGQSDDRIRHAPTGHLHGNELHVPEIGPLQILFLSP